MIARGFGTAAVLLLLVLTLFIVARALGGRGPGQLTPRGLRAVEEASKRDVKRMSRRAAADDHAIRTTLNSSIIVDQKDAREHR